MQICKYANMQICKYKVNVNIQICKYKIFNKHCNPNTILLPILLYCNTSMFLSTLLSLVMNPILNLVLQNDSNLINEKLFYLYLLPTNLNISLGYKSTASFLIDTNAN